MSAYRFLRYGFPSEKFAIQSYTAHFFRPSKTEFITPRGMSLLDSHKLNIDVEKGGRVAIRANKQRPALGKALIFPLSV